MRRGWTLVLANAIVLLGPAAARAEDLSIDQVPPAVRATIEREALGGRIDDIERETKDGRVVYEVEFEQGGRDYEIHVAGDGSLLARRED